MRTLKSLLPNNPYLSVRLHGVSSGHWRRFTSTDSCPSKERSEWKTVVGLEVHAQIASKSKLFSRAGTNFRASVNSNVALHDAAIPGTLPVLNKRCVEAAVLTSLALNCNLNAVSMFDRKHYFYPDLPAGYQITQQRLPLASGGVVTFPVIAVGATPYMKTVRLKQLQLEQDSGRTFLDETSGRKLVDLNRAGAPLMELVFEPDLEDGEEAAALVKELCLLLELLGTCECKMEEGNFRVDANISVHREGEPLGVRTEVKNISSVRAVANAVQWEAKRQIRVLECGDQVVNETRMWDRERACTASMREKETKQDYRYMPEPNLPPLRLRMAEDEKVDPGRVSVPEIRRLMPELPSQTRSLLLDHYGLRVRIAAQILDNRPLLRLFRAAMEDKPTRSARSVANILINPFMTAVNARKISVEDSNFTAAALGQIEDMLGSEEIRISACRFLFESILDGSKSNPREIVAELNLWKITDPKVLDVACQSVISNNPELSNQKTPHAINSLVSLVLSEIRFAADMDFVVERLCKNLGLKEPVDLHQAKDKKKKKKYKSKEH